MRSGAIYAGPIDPAACATCGQDALPRRGQAVRYCSRGCKRKAECARHRASRNAAQARWRMRNPGAAHPRRPGYWRDYYALNRERINARRRAS